MPWPWAHDFMNQIIILITRFQILITKTELKHDMPRSWSHYFMNRIMIVIIRFHDLDHKNETETCHELIHSKVWIRPDKQNWNMRRIFKTWIDLGNSVNQISQTMTTQKLKKIHLNRFTTFLELIHANWKLWLCWVSSVGFQVWVLKSHID